MMNFKIYCDKLQNLLWTSIFMFCDLRLWSAPIPQFDWLFFSTSIMSIFEYKGVQATPKRGFGVWFLIITSMSHLISFNLNSSLTKCCLDEIWSNIFSRVSHNLRCHFSHAFFSDAISFPLPVTSKSAPSVQEVMFEFEYKGVYVTGKIFARRQISSSTDRPKNGKYNIFIFILFFTF